MLLRTVARTPKAELTIPIQTTASSLGLPKLSEESIVAGELLWRYLACMKWPLLPAYLLIFCVCSWGQTNTSKPDATAIFEKSVKAVVVVTCGSSRGTLAQGSGVILRNDGIIATNFHVCGNAETARIKLRNGDVYDSVSVVETDERKDIAILKIKALGLPALTMANSDELKVGSTVYAIGAPLGLEGSITSGLISSIRPVNEMFPGTEGFRIIQLSVSVAHGSSGSPVLDEAGEVVGLIFAGRQESQNLNAAIPINYIAPLVNSLRTGAEFRQLAKIEDKKKDSVEELAGVYSGQWISDRYPGGGHLVMTLSFRNGFPKLTAVLTGSPKLNQEEFSVEFTSVGAGIYKMDYFGNRSKLRGTGLFKNGRFLGDYYWGREDFGRWLLELTR